MRNSVRNEKGMTLVEVMISMVILLLVFVGLIQASLLSIDYNTRNELRDEAVRVAAESMAGVRATPFGNAALVDTGGNWVTFPSLGTSGAVLPGGPVRRNIRLFQQQYDRQIMITDLDPGPTPSLKRVDVRVVWTDPKGETHTQAISANVRIK